MQKPRKSPGGAFPSSHSSPHEAARSHNLETNSSSRSSPHTNLHATTPRRVSQFSLESAHASARNNTSARFSVFARVRTRPPATTPRRDSQFSLESAHARRQFSARVRLRIRSTANAAYQTLRARLGDYASNACRGLPLPTPRDGIVRSRSPGKGALWRESAR
jgi:hypothetical protein